jgi:hypothetical protein
MPLEDGIFLEMKSAVPDAGGHMYLVKRRGFVENGVVFSTTSSTIKSPEDHLGSR